MLIPSRRIPATGSVTSPRPADSCPRARAGRTVLVAAETRSATADQADGFLAVPPERQFETLWTLRALVRGLELDVGDGLLVSWAERLKTAHYAAVFFSTDLRPAATVEALLLLVRDLNEFTRCVAVPLGGPGNPSGAEAVLSWQTGYPAAVDFACGFPRFCPGEATAESRLARAEADTAVIVGGPDDATLSSAARAHLSAIPRIVIAPDAAAATVGLTSVRALASTLAVP